MKLSFGSKPIGTRLTAALLTAVVLLTTATASAQTPSFDKRGSEFTSGVTQPETGEPGYSGRSTGRDR